jgi:Ca-activated chloride channel homolog
MKRAALICFFVLSFLSVVSGQSGRKVAPTPTPLVVLENPATYSESKPLPPRPLRTIPSLRGGTSTDSVASKSDSQAKEPVVENDETAIKVDTNLITIPVSVFDRNGLYIPNIQQNEFKIFEDGVEQEIAYFGTSDKPFTVVLLIDTSASTRYRIEEIRAGAKAFVDQLKPQDRVMVVEFNERVRILAELTNERQAIYRGIDRADFGDGTSIYDAVDQTLRKLLKDVEGRKAVVLFTDGVDTTSRKASYDTTLDQAEESDIIFFPIYYNTFLENRGPMPSRSTFPQIIPSGIGLSAGEYAVGKKYVEELAAYTGGRVFRPESTPGGLTRAFEGIAEELRRQYNIGYVPTSDGKPGQRKSIRVRVGRSNLIVRSRDSYIVGKTK